MDRVSRIAMPLDMADTPDAVNDFFIRVTRLKIEDIEGEIIGRDKQLRDLKTMLDSDKNNTTLKNTVEAIENIIKTRIRSKKAFKCALMKLQKMGDKMFMDSMEDQHARKEHKEDPVA